MWEYVDQIWKLLGDQLQSNQFLAGGAVLGIIAGVLHYCKALPRRIWDAIDRQIFIECDIEDKDESFMWMARWLALHPYGQSRARSLMVFTERPSRKEDNPERDHRPRVIFTPARGNHWFFYKSRLVFLYRGRDEKGGGGGGGDSAGDKKSMFRPENIKIKVLGRSRKVVQQLLEDARELSHPKGERRTAIMTYKWGDWGATVKRRPRPLDSVILKKGIMEDVIGQIEEFQAKEQWYIERGLPYRLGIEFEGPPGSGKTSAIAAIAAYFDMDLAILNLSSSSIGDDELRNLLADIPQNAVVLIEDIDCVFVARKKAAEDDATKISFSGLLNAIDGVAAGEGRILFITTNKHELLDAALIRPGRVDITHRLDAPDNDQVIRIYQRFFPEATATQTVRFVEAVGDPQRTSMAALQGLLVKHCKDAEHPIINSADLRKVEEQVAAEE